MGMPKAPASGENGNLHTESPTTRCTLMNEPRPLISLLQSNLLGECAVTLAVDALSNAGVEMRGAIFTRREVVDFILDLAGYTVGRDLPSMRLLEPSIGEGDFLLPVVDRLLRAWEKAGSPDPLTALASSIRAVELHRDSFNSTRTKVLGRLREAGVKASDAEAVADQWLIYGDFLLAPLDGRFDVVVGNPPYVRQELIADALMAEYRARYRTIFDRADLYIPFIERSLLSLKPGGQLGFICSDRWMKNRYGGPLRDMVARDFRLKIYVDMVDTPAFHSDVIAYPAITVISREPPGATRIARRPAIEPDALNDLAIALLDDGGDNISPVREIQCVTSGNQPWILDSSAELALVRRLEGALPTLEEAACKVGIGVATGADKAFIGRFDDMDVEPDRKLPLAMTRDINSGTVVWRGYGVINPFAESGKLVDLHEYPRLRGYLEQRKQEIAGRHVARKAPARWYRTIDRIYPELARRPKLLIPDIKGSAHIVYEGGALYPHHNLYFVTSDEWDLHALQAVLKSGIARLFVAAYSTRMRGGFLRFQAQYLRRIRVPSWCDVPEHLRVALIEAARQRDVSACNEAVFELYDLTAAERAVLSGGSEA